MVEDKQPQRPEDAIEPKAPLSPAVPATPSAYWRVGLVIFAVLILGLIIAGLG